MGTVYAAQDPELDRRVALKLLHAPRGDNSLHTQARARLLREAQAIAKVTHPNVVHVYEVGVVELGNHERIFLAMELIEGPNLRDWMGELQSTDEWKRGRAWRKIVDIMVQAGRGLAAAHAVGLMHRDFKPDNILVGDDGLVRVIDFGLARRLRERDEETRADLAEHLVEHLDVAALDEPLTVTGAVLGTPAYMAAEQFRGGRTDERTDQFAFCLTLYEALFGLRPFQSDSAHGLACAVMMGELRPWPSQPAVPEHLVQVLRRGLSNEPEARYASIEAVVDAISVDPDQARRRRLMWVGGGLALATATAAGALVTQPAARAPEDPCRAGPARVAERYDTQRAEQLRAALDDPTLPYAARTIEAVVGALDDYALAWAQAYRDACEATHVRHEQTGDLLDKRMACLERRLTALDATITELSRDDQESLLPHALGIAGKLPGLEPCANTVALRGLEPPSDDEAKQAVSAAQEQLDIAGTKVDAHRYVEARALLKALQPEIERIGYRPLESEYNLALALSEDLTDNHDEAIRASRRALMLAQAAGYDALVRDSAARLAHFIGIRKADHEAALVWADLADATAERVGWSDAKRADLLRSRAWILAEWGGSREAIDVAKQALATAERAYGPDGIRMSSAHSSLGSVYGRLSEHALAETQFRRVVELSEMHLGPDHPDLINTYLNLGNVLSARGKLEEARAAFDRSIAVADRVPNITPTVRARTLAGLGNLLLSGRRWEEAIEPHEQALALRREVLGPGHPLVARSLISLGNAYTNLHRDAEATQAYDQAVAIREAALGPDSPALIIVLNNLGTHHVRHGHPEVAIASLERAAALLGTNPQDAYRAADNAFWLGRALYESDTDKAKGSALVDKAIEQMSALGNPGLLATARTWRADNP